MTGKHALKTASKARKSAVDGKNGDDTTADPPGDPRARIAALLRHPAAAPTGVTLVAVLLVIGAGWLSESGEPGPSRLATPLAAGGSYSGGSSGDGGPGRAAASQEAAAEGTVVELSGRRAIALHTWLDVPLVAPAMAANPLAPYAMIPGAEPTTRTPSGSGTGSTTGTGGSSTSSGSGGSTVTTLTPTTVTPPTTETPTTETPTTAPPPTTQTPTTETPTTETPTTETPTTAPPDTLPTEPVGGLPGAVDGVVDEVTGLLVPEP